MPENRSVILRPDQHQSEVKKLLDAAFHQIIAGLPASYDERYREAMGDRIRRVVRSMANRPNMNKITPREFAIKAIRLAEIGLDPEPTLGQIHLIPFKDTLQIVIGYRGYIELGYRSGKLLDIDADVVYPEDFFQYRKGRDMVLEHIPNFEVDHGDNPNNMRLAYAVATVKGGGKLQVVLPRWEVLRHRARSSAFSAGLNTPWKTDEAAMWKKTAIRVLQKVMPQSAEQVKALETDFDSDPRERPAETQAAPEGDPIIETPGDYERLAGGEVEAEGVVVISELDETSRNALYKSLKRGSGFTQAQTAAWFAEQGFHSVPQALSELAKYLQDGETEK